MTSDERAALVALLQERLDAFLARQAEALPLPRNRAFTILSGILKRNIENGRVERYAKKWQESEALTLQVYIDRLIENWAYEYARVKRLDEGNAEEWNALGQKLAKQAQRWLYKLGSRSLSKRSSEDIVQDTFQQILDKPFPFDVKFEAWAVIILQNVVFGVGRSRDVLENSPQSLDDMVTGVDGVAQTSLGDLLPDTTMEDFVNTLQDKDLVVRTLEQMNNRKYVQVLKLKLFDDASVEEIAKHFDCSTSYVHVLYMRASRKFKQIILKLDERKELDSTSQQVGTSGEGGESSENP